MNNPRIIITGIAGFIGSHLAKQLCNLNFEVIGIDNFLCGYQENLSWIDEKNHKITIHKLSVSDDKVKEIIKKGDIVIHLAAITALPSNQIDTVFSYKNNVLETLSLLEVSRLKGISHFIFASSCCVYENNIYTEPIKEDVIIEPTLIYSLGKKHCEDLIKSYNHNYNLQYTILRLFNVYGPGADNKRIQSGIIPYIIRELRLKNPINLYHDGTQKRDYIFLYDVIELFIKVITITPQNTIVNVSSGTTISANEIFLTIKEVMNIEEKCIYNKSENLWNKFNNLFTGELPFKKTCVKHDVLKFTLGDTTKPFTLYNWKAKTTFKEGILQLINT